MATDTTKDMDARSDNYKPQTSAWQAARVHQSVTVCVIIIMIIVMLGVTVWLVRLSRQTEAEMLQETHLTVPVTTSSSRVVTRKQEPERPDINVPKRHKRPENTSPRPLLVNPQPYKEPTPSPLPHDRMVI